MAGAMYGPLAESVWWAICIDEELEAVEGYRSRRNTDPQGNVVNGLRYARSALGHHRFFAVQTAGGLSIPYVIPYKIETFGAWLPVADLPDFDQQSTFRPRYEQYVAGRRVLDTLVDAAGWFDRACAESLA
ncbi:hypothetical protein KIV56_12540 [Cryobacterium breve]|uniref:Uncharacterized protein n=1 Tax=Cryobacterium breve TaxID=1259258 RepID=A0ABY7N9X6_9MICO|nr:hypothetical protein [Cryobacterium breve]WBM79271.1 hypothetical protein KIV56_12540 [Cryobacterium breve]